jgi:hypothetical protein
LEVLGGDAVFDAWHPYHYFIVHVIATEEQAGMRFFLKQLIMIPTSQAFITNRCLMFAHIVLKYHIAMAG